MATSAKGRARPTARRRYAPSPPGAKMRGIQFTIAALDNPLRQRILAVLLKERGPLTFTEVARHLGVADDSSVSFHLNRLTGPLLVSNYLQKTPRGIRSIYEITEEGVLWMKRLGLTRPEVLSALLDLAVEDAGSGALGAARS
jgi:DNA-binding transcriptional ArsR family regulator